MSCLASLKISTCLDYAANFPEKKICKIIDEIIIGAGGKIAVRKGFSQTGFAKRDTYVKI